MNKTTFTRALSGFCRLHDRNIALLYPLKDVKDFETARTLEFLCAAKDIHSIVAELNREANLDLSATRDEEGAWVCSMQQESGRSFRIIFHQGLDFMGLPYLSLSEVFQRCVTVNDINYLDPVDQIMVLLFENGVKKHDMAFLERYREMIRQTAKENPDALLENLLRITTSEKALEIEEQINRGSLPETMFHGMGWRFVYMAWKFQGLGIVPFLCIHYARKAVKSLIRQISRHRNKL